MSTAHPWRSLLLAFASAACSCANPGASSPGSEEGGVGSAAPSMRIEGMAPNGHPYPRLVPCRSQRIFVSIFAGDLAKLGIVGVSAAPEGATPLDHYLSSAADLEAKTMAELVRRHGAGLVKCESAACREDASCGLFVDRIHPNAPDGDARGAIVPDDSALPKRWKASADHRTCSYATSPAGPAATAVFQLTVGCKGCGTR